MSWLADFCPSVRALKSRLDAASADAMFYLKLSQDRAASLAERGDELNLTRKARDEQARRIDRLSAELEASRDARDVLHADLVSATDASARFRGLWEESAERAAKAERIASFYRTAFLNCRRAVDNASADGPPA